jgi:YYY domain-containing protein
LRLPGLDTEAFVSEQFDMVGPDDEAKVQRIADQLARVDYVVESSPRIWGTVTRLPARFPSTIRFFDGLDSGALGFERVATFTNRPRLGPFELDDSHAEEAFSVYDHPEVRIWQKVRAVARDDVVELLDPIAASNALPVVPTRGWANGLLLYDDEIARNAAGPTYDDAFDDGAPAFHVVGWFLLLELFGFAAFALFLPVLGRLPDAGLGMSKTLALAAMSLAVFVWATWLDHTISRASVTSIAVAFTAIGLYAAWRSRRRLAAVWRDRRAVLVAVECVGAVLFVGLVLLRAANPDLWHEYRGGEKPFELALLTAVLRARTLPVYDPWFSGGALNYHYGGWFLLTVPARLLRTSPSLVMNVGLGVFASCAGSAAFSVGAVAFARPRRAWARARRARQGALAAGVLAAFGVLLLSSSAIVVATYRRATGGEVGAFDWWGLSRVIPRSVAITEFPAWSLLYGDMHPHVMGITVIACLGGCCIALHDALVARRARAALVLAATAGVLVGFVRMTNTWDLPLAYVAVALAFAPAAVARLPWRGWVPAALVTTLVVIVLWYPYVSRGEVFDGGFERSVLRTPFTSWLQQFALFAIVTLLVVGVRVRHSVRVAPPVTGRINQAHLLVAAAVLLAIGYAARGPGNTVVAICALLGIGSLWATVESTRNGTGRALPALLLAIGWAIQVAVELFTVLNDGGRKNTVFKFWYQSWIVLAIGSAAALAELAIRARGGTGRRHAPGPWVRRTSRAVLGASLVITIAFWWQATPIRLDDRVSDGGLGLDGEAYLRDDFEIGAGDERITPAADVPLVRWLRHEVAGIQVVAEAPGEDYRWTSRISAMTGLPTPIGWGFHQLEQRRPYVAALDRRRADMQQLYTTRDLDVVAGILDRYDVAFVVYGTWERVLAADDRARVLRGFECLDVVYEGDGIAAGTFVASVDATCLTRWRSSG